MIKADMPKKNPMQRFSWMPDSRENEKAALVQS